VLGEHSLNSFHSALKTISRDKCVSTLPQVVGGVGLESITDYPVFVTFGIDVVFFAPALKSGSTDGHHAKKTLGTLKEILSK
jgi:hypothetical protein